MFYKFLVGALRDIQSELKGYEFYCFGVAKRIKGGTDLPELIESTSTSNPPRPQGLSLYGKLLNNKSSRRRAIFLYTEINY